jgi:hypothetical protein
MKSKSWPVRLARGFAMFWWDFLVGDTPELFVAALVIIGVVALISLVMHANGLAIVALPFFSIAALGISISRALRVSNRR